MKIRNGFVSNSSSSSFIIVKPIEIPKLSEIPEYYHVNKELPEELQGWISILIWYALNNSVDEVNSHDLAERYDYMLNDERVKWYIERGYRTKEYYDNFKKNITEHDNHVTFDVKGWCSPFEDFTIPYGISSELDSHSEEMFVDTDLATGIFCH